jgi:hypothetical protein
MRLKASELTLNTILRVLIVENIINKRGRIMALQQQIILEAPEFGNGRKSDNRPVDLSHLSKQTSGDRNLERNLLDMFARFRTHNQNKTVAARAIAETNTFGHLS